MPQDNHLDLPECPGESPGLCTVLWIFEKRTDTDAHALLNFVELTDKANEDRAPFRRDETPTFACAHRCEQSELLILDEPTTA